MTVYGFDVREDGSSWLATTSFARHEAVTIKAERCDSLPEFQHHERVATAIHGPGVHVLQQVLPANARSADEPAIAFHLLEKNGLAPNSHVIKHRRTEPGLLEVLAVSKQDVGKREALITDAHATPTVCSAATAWGYVAPDALLDTAADMPYLYVQGRNRFPFIASLTVDFASLAERLLNNLGTARNAHRATGLEVAVVGPRAEAFIAAAEPALSRANIRIAPLVVNGYTNPPFALACALSRMAIE